MFTDEIAAGKGIFHDHVVDNIKILAMFPRHGRTLTASITSLPSKWLLLQRICASNPEPGPNMEKLSQDMGASPVATPARAQRTDPQEQ